MSNVPTPGREWAGWTACPRAKQWANCNNQVIAKEAEAKEPMSGIQTSRALVRQAGQGSPIAPGDWTKSLVRLWLTAASPLRRTAYRWHSQRLMHGVRAGIMPRHIGMVLDGNRRFARRAGFSDVTEGHRRGARKVEEVIGWCDELQVPVVTLWGLSVDNLKRPSDELDGIFQVIGEGLEKFWTGPARRDLKRRIRVVGRTELLPVWLQKKIKDVEQETLTAGPWVLNVALAYGGREEVLNAVRCALLSKAGRGESVAQIAESLTTEEIQGHLYTADLPEPDLIIRTSGEIRLSGFLLWQSVYSELHFCNATWPALRKIDFLRAIHSYQGRRRRYGR